MWYCDKVDRVSKRNGCFFEGGGGGKGYFLWIINGTFEFTILRKINWGSYEKIIRFYFLYEILKESIFFKKISQIYGIFFI